MTHFDARSRYGRVFEEFEVGDVYKHWPGKTVTQAENHIFCLLTMAASPIHVDAHFAETEMPAGQNLVVGTMVYSLLLGMSVPETSGRALAALGTEKLRHVAPLFHNDTLYAETTVLAKRVSESQPQAGIVTVETRGRNQDDLLVCTFERSFLVPRQEVG